METQKTSTWYVVFLTVVLLIILYMFAQMAVAIMHDVETSRLEAVTEAQL